MATVNDALIIELKAEISGLKSGIATATSEIQKFAGEADKGANRVKASTIAIGVAMTDMAKVAFTSTYSMAKSVINAGMEMQQLNNKMRASVGSAEAAAAGMNFVRREADRLGLDFQQAADGFANFSASAMRNGFTLQQSQSVFQGLSVALTALQVPAEQSGLAFLALEQMAGKGTIQLQEVKQLINALPGALEYMAQAMGVSTSEFQNMISNGKALSTDVLPKLADLFRSQFGEQAVAASRSASAEFKRLGNAIFNLKTNAANGEFMDKLANAIRAVTAAVSDPRIQKGLGDMVTLLGALSVKAIEAAAAMGRFYEWANKRIEKAGDTIFGALFGEKGAQAIAKARGGTVAGGMDTGGGGLVSSGSKLLSVLGGASLGGAGGAASPSGGSSGDLQSKLDSLRGDLAGPTDKLALEYEKQKKQLKEFLKDKLISEQEYRDLNMQAELDYKNKYGELWAKQAEEEQNQRKEVEDNMLNLRRKGADAAVGLLQQLGQKNKAFAIAAIALEKAQAIASIMIEAQKSAMAARFWGMAHGGPAVAEALAAREMTAGYVAAGLVAAQGIAQAAMTGGGGGSGGSSGGSVSSDSSGSVSNSGSTGTSTPAPKAVYINIEGEFFGPRQLRDLVNGLNTYLGDGTLKLNVSGGIA